MAEIKDDTVYVLNDKEVQGLYYEFANRLAYLREINNTTQYALAKALHMKQPTISGYELGFALPAIPTLVAISNYFDVTVDYLLGKGERDSVKKKRRHKKQNEKILAETKKTE